MTRQFMCQYCGSMTTKVFTCPECGRKGCPNCMPMGDNACPECGEEYDPRYCDEEHTPKDVTDAAVLAALHRHAEKNRHINETLILMRYGYSVKAALLVKVFELAARGRGEDEEVNLMGSVHAAVAGTIEHENDNSEDDEEKNAERES